MNVRRITTVALTGLMVLCMTVAGYLSWATVTVRVGKTYGRHGLDLSLGFPHPDLLIEAWADHPASRTSIGSMHTMAYHEVRDQMIVICMGGWSLGFWAAVMRARASSSRRGMSVPSTDGVCRRCDYDLRGQRDLVAHCPECGHAYDLRLWSQGILVASQTKVSWRSLGCACATGCAVLMISLASPPDPSQWPPPTTPPTSPLFIVIAASTILGGLSLCYTMARGRTGWDREIATLMASSLFGIGTTLIVMSL